MDHIEERSEIVFFDVETTIPTRQGQGRAILEFGAILLCPGTMVELDRYSTLVRPADLSLLASLSPRSNGITPEALVSAPSFLEISDRVYDLLHGRIWAGHNIEKFDCARIREAFAEIGRPAPEPKAMFDSLVVLTQRFGRRAGDMKMASLANYFGIGQQRHRSLDDVQMNVDIVKRCATVLLLESSLPEIFTTDSWVSQFLEPDEVSIPSICASHVQFFSGRKKIMLHNAVVLQLCCIDLSVRFGLSTRFVDDAGRPKLSFVVDICPRLCQVLDACDNLASRLTVDSGSNSEWIPVVKRDYNPSTVRLNIPSIVDREGARYATEIYERDSSGTMRELEFSCRDPVEELGTLLAPGTLIDAYFSLDLYDYQRKAGIRLVAKKLIFESA